ncbi:MAG: glycosyltransferase [Bacteroidales bacterium]|jgi:glycosyltransferase involved in cell wall biosynthesis|nr:glycosyltransferase [Bacteroidales bacterium]
MKILFLSAWYPHRSDAMDGLFVRKHAQAVALYAQVCVLYVHADAKITNFEITQKTIENVLEISVYFPFSNNALLRKISKQINYVRAFWKGYSLVKRHFGKPNSTLVNILTRTAVLALWLKVTQNIPYAIIEHWSRYLPQNNSYKGFLRKRVTEYVARRAKVLMTVSEHVTRAMQRKGIKANYKLIYNVVDDFFFEPAPTEPRSKKRILHVSCFDDRAKNVSGLLRAAKQLSEQRSDFELIMVGTGVDFEACYKLYESLQFPQKTVLFLGELPPEKVAHEFHRADFFVLFSNYDNAPVVISESFAAGKPVVASRVAGIPEMVNETNGILVEPENETEIYQAMNQMLDTLENYDAATIRRDAEKYRRTTVGKRIMELLQ